MINFTDLDKYYFLAYLFHFTCFRTTDNPHCHMQCDNDSLAYILVFVLSEQELG